MRITTRFSIAVHILSILGMEVTAEPTSEQMAESAGVNPVMVRNITGMLKKAGLVTSRQGKARQERAWHGHSKRSRFSTVIKQ